MPRLENEFTVYLDMTKADLEREFKATLLATNRAANYYIDMRNIDCNELYSYRTEMYAMNSLINVVDEQEFYNEFCRLLTNVPKTLELIPLLFGLAKIDRNKCRNNDELEVITQIGNEDSYKLTFNPDRFDVNLIDQYYTFFCELGLKQIFQDMLEDNVFDYCIGVLVGMDSNGRKNRGGNAFELACEPIISDICARHHLYYKTQVYLDKYCEEKHILFNPELASHKLDFLIYNGAESKFLNIEVNFYNSGGSKPNEIIPSYITRQEQLAEMNWSFIQITDGLCWNTDSQYVDMGFNRIHYIMNYNLARNGMLEEAIVREFNL